MTVLSDYHHFAGRHWETDSLHNVLAYQSEHAPRPQAPLSEAMLLGLSGGITVGYFLFGYKGWPWRRGMPSRGLPATPRPWPSSTPGLPWCAGMCSTRPPSPGP